MTIKSKEILPTELTFEVNLVLTATEIRELDRAMQSGVCYSTKTFSEFRRLFHEKLIG